MSIVAFIPYEVDPFEEALFLTLLFLLVLFFRGRSFVANGAFLGAVLALLLSNGVFLLLGLVVGCVARIAINIREAAQTEMKPPVSADSIARTKGLPYWVVVLTTVGISVGLTLGLIFQLTYHQTFVWTGALAVTGSFVGAAVYLAGKRSPGLKNYFELFIVLSLSAGIGAVIGWTIVFRILAFHINPDVSDEVLFRIAILSCGGVACVLGLIAWWFGIFSRKPSQL